MPFGSEGIDEKLTGLAMSGGGFRATLFHLGTLWRLNELAYLPTVDRISSVSGGSITSGVLPPPSQRFRSDFRTPPIGTAIGVSPTVRVVTALESRAGAAPFAEISRNRLRLDCELPDFGSLAPATCHRLVTM